MSVSFEKLSPEQKEIVQHETRRLLILAGPGTGKTEVLIHRIAYLNAKKKVPSDRILAVTFSRKAAKEMIDRLSKFPGLETTPFHVSTLHAESLRLLNEIGGSRKFLVADDEARLLIKDAAEDIGLEPSAKTLKSMERQIELLKANNMLPSEVKDQLLQRFYQRYEELLDFNDAIDLNGLVLKTTRTLLSENSAFSNDSKGHLLVDEYQDINQAEYKLIQILAAKASSLLVVGDDYQSIYGWRGADPKIIRNFKQDFNDGQIKVLKQSHRCTGHILQAAHAIVSKDPQCIEKTLCSSKGDGTQVNILLSKSWTVEAYWITNWIKNYLSKGTNKASDIAVLVKTPSIAESLVGQLKIARINAVYWRSGGFFSDRDILDILAQMRLIADKEDNLALRRCLTPPICYGIGDVAERKLRKIAEKHQCCLWEVMVNAQKFSELHKWQASIEQFVDKINKMENDFSKLTPDQVIQFIAKQMGANKRVKVKGLQDFAKSLPEKTSIKDFLTEVNKNRGVDLAGGGPEPETEAEEAITIMTMHSAKGLGFKVVFILGMDERSLPDLNLDICEQRRLCYVAMTRAKEELFLCHSKIRKGPAARGHSFYKPSRFLVEIPKEHMKIINNEYS